MQPSLPFFLLVSLLTTWHLASAYPTGAPRCSIALDDSGLNSMVNNAGNRQAGTHGWSVQLSSSNYTTGGHITVSVVNTDSNLKFRGLLLWSLSGSLSYVGSFSFDTNTFQVPSVSPCSSTTAALTHKSAVAKLQSQAVFSWTAPADASVTFQAFVVEDCSALSPGCNGLYYLAPSVTATLQTSSGSGSGSGSGTATGSNSGSGSSTGSPSGTGTPSETGTGTGTGTNGGTRSAANQQAAASSLHVLFVLFATVVGLLSSTYLL